MCIQCILHLYCISVWDASKPCAFIGGSADGTGKKRGVLLLENLGQLDSNVSIQEGLKCLTHLNPFQTFKLLLDWF